MAGISSMGIGSGLDINSLVEQLVASERAPAQNRIDSKEAKLQAKLSAYGMLQSALSKFRTSVQDLTKISAFQTMKATTSDDEVVTATAAKGAQTGRFDITVSSLAESQSIASGAFAAKTTGVGSGSLVFRFGTVAADDGSSFSQDADRAAKTVNIDPGANTLADIRDAVNDADIGVTASIINDGSGERLVFTADDTGAANGFVVEATDDDGVDNDASGLSQLAFGPSYSNMSRTRAGIDAALSINGLNITRASNEIDDAIEGVTFSLKDTSATSVRIDVSRDVAAVKGKINGFVQAYNEFQKQVKQLSAYDAENKKASILTGDALTRSISSSLTSVMTDTLDVLDGDAVRALADLGIRTKSDGTLEVDSSKLDDALKDNFDLVGALFASTGLPTDDGVEYVSARGMTEPGRYAVNITSLATQGYLNGTAVTGFPLTIGDANNEFRIKVNGVESGGIVLSSGSYTADELATELQSKINGDSKLSKDDNSVTVEYDSDNSRFVIRSANYGSDATVEISYADAGFTIDLGLSGEGTAGTDVVGTIGGAAATGEGQYLIGADDSDAEGLRLKITGDTTGDRGQVTFSQGLMTLLDDQLAAYLDSDGTLGAVTKGLRSQIDDLADDRERLSLRTEKLKARLTAQFTAMDTLVAQLNSTGQFLTNQLAGLQAMTASKKK